MHAYPKLLDRRFTKSVRLAGLMIVSIRTLNVVSEPDPRKIEKEGLAHWPGCKCTLRNVRNFINCRTLQSL